MQNEISARINALLKMANEKFLINLDNVQIDFSLKGLAAGQVVIDGNLITVRINSDALVDYYDFIYAETLPHEVAHLVQYALEGYLSHDAKWKTYCELLGGTPTRTHSLGLKPTRKQKQWLYKVGDETHILSTIRHNRIQQKGIEYRTNSGNKLGKAHFIQELI